MRTCLGIDLGPESIGWALITPDGQTAAVRAGVRVFEGGLEGLETDGRGESRNLGRRAARSNRRRLWRQARRLSTLAQLLANAGLLPEGDYADAPRRHEVFTGLDRQFGSPFRLRTRALDEPLSPHELGRVLYHLAQRRGFLSNRKSAPKRDDEEGKVKKGISELTERMRESGARTLGELFWRLEQNGERIRGRYTGRAQFEEEFARVWESQSRFHGSILTDDLRKRVHRAIFFQRPLKSVAKFVGHCELEPTQRRAPWALLAAQRFRILQNVNNLRAVDTETGECRTLSEQERRTLIDLLEHRKTMKFNGIRRALKLGKQVQFTIESGGESEIPGNQTTATLAKVFGEERWDSMTDIEKNHVVDVWLSTVTDKALRNWAIGKAGLDEDQAEALTQVKLESGYCRFSRRALARLLPLLDEGKALPTAIKEAYPGRGDRKTSVLIHLPPVRKANLGELRNPVVERSLTELRRVINAIIHRYKWPDEIRIELARDLRQTPAQRKAWIKKNRANERERNAARQKIIEFGIDNPSPSDILKVLLAEECKWLCPYTGRKISMGDLVGPQPRFDIEHIIPFDRSLDDSFVNKTLCEATENRSVKGNRTPHEAYAQTAKWPEILDRVRGFNGRLRDEKLRRFQMTPDQVEALLADFTSRQLNDTRWASRWAKRYLGLLFGGVTDDGIDANGRRCVLATSGGVTAHLRRLWGLNNILGDAETKVRDDHRHHAVDAVVVALTESTLVKALSDAARRGRPSRRLLAAGEPPWEGFFDQVRKVIEDIVVTHRVSRRVRGALHKETFYSPRAASGDGRPPVRVHKAPEGLPDAPVTRVVVRKHLRDLRPGDVDNIVDPKIRDAVKGKLDAIGGVPKDAFKTEENLPEVGIGGGRTVRVRRVRVADNLTVFPVGEGPRRRWVASKSTHHMAVYAVLDEAGNQVKWDAEVVSLYEAHQRRRRNEPIVRRDFGVNARFLFSLAGGDVIELEDNDARRLFVVRTVPESKQLHFVPINDARKLKDIGKTGLTGYPETLRKRNCRKVVLTPLGEVRTARD